MESPRLAYKRLKDIHEIKDIAYDTLVNKYIIRDDKAEKKLTEIDSTDQESLISHLNGGYPIPGLMYTFVYKPGEESVLVKDGNDVKKYNDKIPITLCMNADRGKFSGINMNALPPSERVSLLEVFYNFYKPFFIDVENYTQNDVIAINKQFVETVKSGKGQTVIKIFSDIANANFNFGFRTYDMKKVLRLRMIEFSEWDYIPFYEPKDAFALMNYSKIHNLYWRNK